MLPLGAGLLLSPLAVAAMGPWELTALTGRAIGGWLFAIGIIVVHAVYGNDRDRLGSFTLSYTLLAAMQLLALLRFGSEIGWAATARWVYVLFLLSIGAVGLSGLMQRGTELSGFHNNARFFHLQSLSDRQ